MTGDRTANRERDGRNRRHDSVCDEADREVTHQPLREDESVERSADNADYFSDASIEGGVIRGRQPTRKDISV